MYTCVYLCMYIHMWCVCMCPKKKKRKLWLKVPVYNERGIRVYHKSTIFSGLCFNIQKICSVKVFFNFVNKLFAPCYKVKY